MAPEEIYTVVCICLVAFLAGFIHSAVGFGFGIVAVTLLPLFVDVRQSHVVISTASVPVLLMAAWAFRKGIDWSDLWRALLGAAIFLPIGLLAFEFVSIDLLCRGTGVAILLMIWMSFRNRRKALADDSPAKGSPFFAGAFGGFLAGAVSIAGPPVAAYALSQRWEQERFKAFLNQFLLAVSAWKVIGLALRGFISSESLTQSAILAPMAIVGIQVGAIASRQLSTRRFQYIVAVALILIAIYFVLRGASN